MSDDYVKTLITKKLDATIKSLEKKVEGLQERIVALKAEREQYGS